MTGDLEPMDGQLHDRTRTTALPEAPESLRAFAAGLAAQPPSVAIDRRQRRSRLWIALVPVAILVIGGLAVVAGSSLQKVPAVVTSPSPTTAVPTPRRTASPVAESSEPAVSSQPLPATPAGFRHVSVPGVEFDAPADWTDVTAWVPGDFEIRPAAWFIAGVDGCPGAAPTPAADATSVERCLSDAGGSAGSLQFTIADYVHALPVPEGKMQGNRTTIGGFPAWARQSDSGGSAAGPSSAPVPALTSGVWIVAGPNDSLYLLTAKFPSADGAKRQPEVDAALASLRFTGWTQPFPPAVDGLRHLDPGIGFSADYPADWRLYYPGAQTFGGDSVRAFLVTRPVDACFVVNACDGYMTGPSSMMIWFSIGGRVSVMNPPDWSKATVTIGGQPAVHKTQEDPSRPDLVTEMWRIKFGSSSMGVQAWIRGPKTQEFERQLAALIESLAVRPPAGY